MTTTHGEQVSIAADLLRWGREHWPNNLFVGVFGLLFLFEMNVIIRLGGYFRYLVLSHLPIVVTGLLLSFYILVLRIRLERGATLTPHQRRLAVSSGIWSFGYGFALVGLGIVPLFTSPGDLAAFIAPWAAALMIGGLVWLTDTIQQRIFRTGLVRGASNTTNVSAFSQTSNVGSRSRSWGTVLMVVLLIALVVGSSAWFVKSLPSLMPTYTFTQQDHPVRALAWSPDGKRIASGDEDGNVRIWGAFDGSDVVSFNLPVETGYSGPPWSPSIRSLAWSPDGKDLAVCRDLAGPTVWDTNRGVRIATLDASGTSCNAFAWSPDGEQIATAIGDNGIQLWAATFAADPVTLSTNDTYDTTFVWSPDSSRLGVASSRSTAVIDIATHRTLWSNANADTAWPDHATLIWPTGNAGITRASTSVAQDANGNYYDFLEVLTFDANSGEVLKDLRKTLWDPFALSWCTGCARQSYLAVTDEGDPVGVLDTSNLTEVFGWRGQFGLAEAIAWSPDGRYIASGDYYETVQVWRAQLGG